MSCCGGSQPQQHIFSLCYLLLACVLRVSPCARVLVHVKMLLSIFCSGSCILIVPKSLMIREDERERESGEEPRGMKREAEKEPPWVRLG